MSETAPLLPPETPITGLAGLTVVDFWRWAYSDLLSNRNRALFAEFLVGSALGVLDQPRVEWDSVDLRYGGFGIEVKASAYVQSWPQKPPSRICFTIRRARPWDPETGDYAGQPTRPADCYVFCVYKEQDRARSNVRVNGWEFYVSPTSSINVDFGSRQSVSLADIARIAQHCSYPDLKCVIDRLLCATASRPDRVVPE